MPISYIVLAAAVGFIGFALAFLLQPPVDPREPKHVHGTIPYLSHSIGLMTELLRYYQQMRYEIDAGRWTLCHIDSTASEQVKLPIFTLPVPGTKLYVVSSPQLVLAVQKLPREIAFPPVAIKFSTVVAQCSQETADIMYHNISGDHGDLGYSQAVHKTIREALVPGPKLNESIRPMIRRVTIACDGLARSSPQAINLADWLRHEIVAATAVGIWGPDNLFLDPKVEKAFWQFQDNLYGVMFGFIPTLSGRRARRARQTCTDAFYTYFLDGKHEYGSELSKIRYKTSCEHGVSVLEIAKLEVLNVMATVTNTYPAIFWMIYYVFSQPSTVLADLRNEIEPQIVSGPPRTDGSRKHVVDLTRLKASCPLLLSTMQETLRVRSIGGSFRQVTEDVQIDGASQLGGPYLLKKGMAVVLPSQIYHSSAEHWGPDVAAGETFDHRRFAARLPRKTAAAFRAFGGGQHLRHFATSELLAVVAMLILRFDITPLPGKGAWPEVRVENVKLWAQLTEPDHDLNVNVTKSQSWGEGDEWEFVLSDGEKDAVVRMTLEDLE